MSSGNTDAHAGYVPKHGGGKLLPWQPGVSPNPSGRPKGLRELQQACRKKSLDGFEALCRVIDDTVIDEGGRVRNREDGRVVVLAVQTLWSWGFGRPVDYDPREDKPPLNINLSVLSTDEKRMMLESLRRGLLTEAVHAEPESASEQIEASAEQPCNDAPA